MEPFIANSKPAAANAKASKTIIRTVIATHATLPLRFPSTFHVNSIVINTTHSTILP